MFLYTNRKRKINQEDCTCMFVLYKTNDALGSVGNIQKKYGALTHHIKLLEDHYMDIGNVDFEHLYHNFECDTALDFYEAARTEFPRSVE